MQVSIKSPQNYLFECADGVSKLLKQVVYLREELPKRS
jgi:hypothetical protein